MADGTTDVAPDEIPQSFEFQQAGAGLFHNFRVTETLRVIKSLLVMATTAPSLTSQVDPNFLISTMYPAANSAYLIMSVPNPSLPPGYQLVGPLLANVQDAARAMAQSQASEQRAVNMMLAESNIFGLVAYNAADSTAIVAFRGTQTIWEWIEDLCALTFPYLPDPNAGDVHMGFQLVYEHIRKSTAELLAKCNGVKRIYVTGHSLGGAVALLGAFDIVHNTMPGVPVEIYTFAGPRTGTGIFTDSINKLIPKCVRVVNHGDLVPEVPVPPIYSHAGQALGVVGGFKLLDVTYGHHLTTYLTGLQKLPGAGPGAGSTPQ